MRSKPFRAFAQLAIVSAALGVGIAAGAAVPPGTELLSAVDRLLTFDEDLSVEATLTQTRLGGASSATVAAVFRRDRADELAILLLAPREEKGKGYLKKGENLWLYDPKGKAFVFKSAKDVFQNSGARNSDFVKWTLERDYAVAGVAAAKLGKYECKVLDLVAKTEAVSFPRRKIWVSEDGLPRMIEDYSAGGALLRTVAMPTFQKLGDKYLPLSTIILDNLRSRKVGDKVEYEKTTIDLAKASVKRLPDTVFTKEYLERMSK